MSVVAGVDFGTLSVRVTLVDSKKGPIGTASAPYPLHRRREDPNFATQSHADQMAALAAATRDVLKTSGLRDTPTPLRMPTAQITPIGSSPLTAPTLHAA